MMISCNNYDLVTLRYLAKDVKVVSFDFFDTLFIRPIDDPEDVFDFIGMKYNISGFRALRKKAQTEAFRHMIKAGRKEIKLRDIYNNFVELGHLRHDIEKTEYNLELELVEPNPIMLSFFNEMIAAGKTVVITSDMYFGESFFESALNKYNVKLVPLFISADQNATKRDTGEIFDKITESLNVRAGEILHIGDNHMADVLRPSEKGVLTWHYNPYHLQNKNKNQCLASSIIKGLFRSHNARSIQEKTFSELGYKYQAPATLGFLNWIELECQTDGITKLLFVSRDGYSLENLAKLFFQDRLPSFSYFMGSRTAFNLALMNQGNFLENIPFLMSGSDGLSPGELLERIGVEPPENDVMESLGISTNTIIDPSNYELVNKFLVAYQNEILKVCQKNRQGLFMYLRQLGIKPGDKIGLVDVGWSGTTQESFEKTIKTFMDVDVVGYYFCLANTHEKARRERMFNMKALINNESVGHCVVDSIYKNRIAVELFFSAPHETVIGYKPTKNCVHPVLDVGRAKSKNHNEIISLLNTGLDAFITDFIPFVEKLELNLSPLQLSQPLIDLVSNDEWLKNPLFNEVENFDSWGSSRNQNFKFADYFKQH